MQKLGFFITFVNMYNQETAINKVKEVHGETYGYDKMIFTKARNKIIVTCKIHGDFEINFSSHVSTKRGCKKCGYIITSKNRAYTLETIKEKFKEIHNDFYDYSKITEYKTTEDSATIICPKHGEFEQLLKNHIVGRGCYYCGREKVEFTKKHTPEQAMQRCIDAHGDLYNYPNFNYTGENIPIEIECKKHGIFKQKIRIHSRGGGCTKCSNEKRKGFYNLTRAERKKEEWLEIPTKIYYLKFTNETETFWKVGLSKNPIKKRFVLFKGDIEVIKLEDTNLYDGTILENKLISEHKQYSYIPKTLIEGRTECFSKDILKN